MIRSVEITNFKNIRHQRIELEPLTVFVGANASGKTSVLEAIDLALWTSPPSIHQNPNAVRDVLFNGQRHCDWLYTRGGKGSLSISCTTWDGTFGVSATPPEGYPSAQVELFGKSNWVCEVSPPDNSAFEVAIRPVENAILLRLDAAELAAPSYSDVHPPWMKLTGRGLASVLSYMALNAPDNFDGLVAELRRVVPNLKRIRFTKSPVYRTETELVRFGADTVERQAKREYQGDAMLFDFQNAANVAAHAASEGTLLLLGLLAVLLGPRPPDVLLLDDIDRALHPLAQASLLQILAKIMDRFPNLQILATAHSPYLVDALKPEQLRLMTLDANGDAICGRLTDHPEFDKWKDEMAPGEMWSLFGEKWLAEGGTAK